jgi:hypothetical protein|tara:strand:+ start:810 stop:1163 length:354 start_codon:yes stop_codon:yes gene_type:complete
MTSKGILYVIISGIKDHKRATEALRLAEYQAGDARNVALMLQGEGVEWLEEGNENFRKEIQISLGVISELGSPVFLCGASLNERGLTPTMGEYKFTTSSAPKRINQVIDKGWQIAIF